MSGWRAGVIWRILSILIFGVTVGGLVALLTIGFVELFHWGLQAWRPTDRRIGLMPDWNLRVLLVPALGGLAVGLLLQATARRRAFTLADLIAQVQVNGGAVSLKCGGLNGLASVVALGSGASVGPYAPLAVMGANLAAGFARLSRSDINCGIGCGVAAAISTAFSAPIAGIIFAHEVILRHYSLRAFAPITVASSTGFFIANYLFKRPVVLQLTEPRSMFAPEIFSFVLIGVCGALVAVVFMRSILLAARLARRIRLPQPVKPALAGLFLGLLAQWLPEVLGPGTATIKAALSGLSYGTAELFVLLLAKLLATAVCIGFGFAGGVFSPALLIGILLGAGLGQGAEVIYGAASSGPVFYAICGMVAVTSPVIGAPLTTILIVFELTRNYELTIAVMVSVVFSNVVAYRLFGRSLFDVQLGLDGCDLSAGRDQAMLQRTDLTHFIHTDFITVAGSASLAHARAALIEAGGDAACVVDGAAHYIGKLRLNAILALEQQVDLTQTRADQYADATAPVFQDTVSVWQAMQTIRDQRAESIPVIDRHGRVVGIIHPAGVLDAYLATVQPLRAEENATY